MHGMKSSFFTQRDLCNTRIYLISIPVLTFVLSLTLPPRYLYINLLNLFLEDDQGDDGYNDNRRKMGCMLKIR